MIKRDCLFTVVIGNPPYSSLSQNMGNWIKKMVSDFRKIDGVPIYEKGKRNHQQDDYVKFLRLGLAHIERSGVVICVFITNHSYVYSPTFRALRNYIFRNINSGKIIWKVPFGEWENLKNLNIKNFYKKKKLKNKFRLFIAYYINNVRLIDNI